MKQFCYFSLILIVFISCKTELKETAQEIEPIIFEDIDTSIKPGDDFFNHVNKNWMDNAVIADDQVGVGAYRFLNIPQQELLKNIFKVRKTVKIYVYYNLITFIILSIVINVIIFSDRTKLKEIFNAENINIDESSFFTIMLVTQIISLFVFLALFWLFYQLLYGILLKKLNKNYKELAKLDELN